MMKMLSLFCALSALVLPAPLAAQSLTLSGGSEAISPQGRSDAPVTAPAAEAPSTPTALPLPEQRVREGLVLLNALHDTMAGINDEASAEAAVAPLMRLHRALQEWTQAFSTLPPLSEQEQQAYEEQYIPLFKKINGRIRTQGDRLAAAEYYGSRDLTAALMHIAIINH